MEIYKLDHDDEYGNTTTTVILTHTIKYNDLAFKSLINSVLIKLHNETNLEYDFEIFDSLINTLKKEHGFKPIVNTSITLRTVHDYTSETDSLVIQ